MVRRKVRHDGDMAAVAKVHKLERAQLQHDEVVRRHVLRLVEQRRTDIAAGPDAMACMLQDFGDKRARRRLAVRAGHADDPAGADLEKGLHFRGKLRPCGTQRLQLRLSRVQTGRSEGHIAGDARQIIIAEVQLRAEALQLEHLRVELLPRRAVAARDVNAKPQQQAHERPVAYTEAKHQHALPLQPGEIFRYSHDLCPSFPCAARRRR